MSRGETLYGREAEAAAIAAMLDRARSGQGGGLLIRGEAGIGKTALLDLAARSAGDMTVLRATAIETEAELPFAGLHLLLAPVLTQMAGIPWPRARALERVLGLAAGPAPPPDDVFLTGLAVVSLLTRVAEDRPVVCLIDDAHWLDTGSATALLLAARRLDQAGVAMLLALRDRPWLATSGLPALDLEALSEDAARQLLRGEGADLDPLLSERVLADSAGNPLAITELARAARTGPGLRLEGAPWPLRAGQRVQQIYGQQIGSLPDETRMLLLIAAASGTCELAPVLAAANAVGLDASALSPAEIDGLVIVTDRTLAFRHPLVRAAAYHGSPIARRQAAHRALAEVVGDGGNGSTDRRAWHLASAAAGRDDRAAAELELAAEQARQLSGYAAVAAAYERSAELTTDPAVRARRLVAAANAASDIGESQRAERLLAAAESLSDDPLLRAEAAYLRSRGYTADHRESLAALAYAAEGVASSHPGRALRLLRGMVIPARMSGQDTLAARVTERLAELETTAMPQPADGESEPAATADERMLAGIAAWWHGDNDTALTISARLAEECRQRGMTNALAGVLHCYGLALAAAGDTAGARAALLEGLHVATGIGQSVRVGHAAALLAVLAAGTGDEPGCRSWLDTYQRHDISDDAWGYRTALPAIMAVARGRFEAALALFRAVPPEKWRAGPAFWYMPDIVEAAARGGDLDWAREVTEIYGRWASRTGQAWAAAVAARCRGLSDSSEQAERHFTEALRWHSGTGRPVEEARTRLVYGELLRRRKRRADAAAQLSRAIEIFDELEATARAERARSELAATGLIATRAEAPGALARLTRQEYQIATLVAEGKSNREIAAQLFLSHRTVGYHLYKAYPKLGISSRTQLADVFAQETRADR